MDLEEYWQGNKRFVGLVGLGAAVFLVAFWVVSSAYAGDIASSKRARTAVRGKLGAALYSRSDLELAERENETLEAALATLRASVAFAPRARFVLDPTRGSPSNQYLRVSSDVRDELLVLANRAGTRLVASVGLPDPSPTREAEIVRYLEAVDVIERVVRAALDEGVAGVDSIRIRLDPAMQKRGVRAAIEKTRVELQMSGPSLPLVRLVERTQRPGVEGAAPLAVGELSLKPSSRQLDEARLDLVVLIPRLLQSEATDKEY